MHRCPKRGPDVLKANILVAEVKIKLSSPALAPGLLMLDMLNILLSYSPVMLGEQLETSVVCSPVQKSK